MANPSNEKRYVCTHQGCNKTFNRRDYLDRHSTNHLQVKPFVCEECERQFSRRDLYENHLTTRFHARRALHRGTSPEKQSLQPETVPAPTDTTDDSTYYPTGPTEPSEPSDTPMQFNLDLGSHSSGTGVRSSIFGLDSDFDGSGSVNYSSLPGFESERWEFYRPFKRSSELGGVGSRDLGGRDLSYGSLPKRMRYGSMMSEAGSEGTIFSSEATGTTRTFETDLSSNTLASSLGSAPPAALAPTPAAYKMWLIDRFQSTNDADTNTLREPAGEDALYDKQYEWFFDNNFHTANGKFGYDRMYTQSVSAFTQRADRFKAANYSRGIPDTPLMPLSEDRRKLLLQIFANNIGSVLTSSVLMDKYIADSWQKAKVIACILHRPTFNPNTAHPALVAAMTLIGMAHSSEIHIRELAKAATPNVSLYVYESLNQPEGLASTRYSLAYVGHFVAFCLLLKYEPLILGRDLYNSSLIRASSCRRSADKFLSKLIGCVAQTGTVPKDPELFVCQRKPVWASISQEGYAFHQGADRDLQWLEWAAYEVCKRTIHFSIYSDSVISMCDEPNSPAVSLFNMDIHMVCPDPVWEARDSTEFFYLMGSSSILSNLPYLGLLKSLVRFPRGLAENATRPHNEAEIVPLSLMALRMIAHGLMNIVSRLSGVATRGDAVMQAVLAKSPNELAIKPSQFFDVSVQARLYRGLDIWFQHFEASCGKVTDRLFDMSDALGFKINDEVLEDINDEADDKTIPQYALYLVLYHYSSFIVVHEDLPIVLQFTANLAKWLKNPSERHVNQQELIDFLYMPLYTQWIQSDEAKAMVSTAGMYLVWVDAASGQVQSKTWKNLFLSAVIYTSVLVFALYDLVAHHRAHNGDMSSYSAGHVATNSYDFMEQAMLYTRNVVAKPGGPQDSTGPPVISVLLAGACILYVRPHTHELYERLEQLICVFDPSLTPDRIRLVLEGAQDMFLARHAGPADEAVKIKNEL